MNDVVILQAVLVANVLMMVGSVVVALKYYYASVELHKARKCQQEADNGRFAQDFQAQLWQEKRSGLEKELVAYKNAHEKACRDLVALQERFNGLEQAYHEARQQLNPVLLKEAQEEEKPKRRGKR